jgi:signal transduction histidine kinase
MQTYHQNLHLNPPEPSYLIIHGDEGMGKTYIVETLLCNQVRVTDGGLFVVWNFPCQHPNYDRDVTLEASDGLDDVIISLVHQIMIAGDTIVQEIQESFMQEMEIKDRTFLVQMIPQFSTLLDPTIEQSSLLFNYSINLRAPELRMRTLLQVLRIVSKPNRPIVLFMDNVEYANENNRRLIESLLQETAIQRIFYVMEIGPNKSSAMQNFLQSIQNIPASVRSAVKIQLPPLGATVTQTMVADILQTDLDSIEPLHSFLQPRIKGNPRFLISWLSWLYRNDYLQWNTASQAWSWDTDQFLVHNDDRNTSRTTWDDLPKSIQYFLQGMIIKNC